MRTLPSDPGVHEQTHLEEKAPGEQVPGGGQQEQASDTGGEGGGGEGREGRGRRRKKEGKKGKGNEGGGGREEAGGEGEPAQIREGMKREEGQGQVGSTLLKCDLLKTKTPGDSKE